MTNGSNSVDLLNAITALIGTIGTSLGAAVSFIAARSLLRNSKNSNGSQNGNGDTGRGSSGGTGGGTP